MCCHGANMPYLLSIASTQTWLSGVVTCLGSGAGLAGASTVGGVPAEAAPVEIRAIVSERAVRVVRPGEAVLLSVGGEERVFALRVAGDGGRGTAMARGASTAISW
jgi:hypothetical protein